MEKQHKILVVDKDPAFVKMARESLSNLEVSAASTRIEGLNKAKRESPETVILGYVEPRGDALQLCRELRASQMTKHIPILVVDVSPEEHARKGWRKSEGVLMDTEGYISRPVEPAYLAELVADIIQRSDSKTMELRDALEQMERVLKSVERIEKMLAR